MRRSRSAFVLLRLGFGDDLFELVGDGGEVARRGRSCGLVERGEQEFDFLGLEVAEPRLEAAMGLRSVR